MEEYFGPWHLMSCACNTDVNQELGVESC